MLLVNGSPKNIFAIPMAKKGTEKMNILALEGPKIGAVSYTHLTLPTNREV